MAWRSSSVAVQGQIFLDAFNPILRECISPRLKEGLRKPCELRVSDFDDATYKVTVTRESLAKLTLSVNFAAWSYIKVNGGEQMIDALYPNMKTAKPETGYSFTLIVDLDSPSLPADMLLKNLTELKRNIVGSPFTMAFAALQNGAAGNLTLVSLPWRQNEDVYIIPQDDRVTVIFAVDFVEADERALCKVFLMEFADAQRSANNAPPTNFSQDPPLELRDVQIRGRPVGYLSFIMFPQHVQAGLLESSVTLLVGFRNYLHYHIKATKTYMHMRMRKRAAGLLQVLNRAIPEAEDKAKKTAQGKTFVRT